MGGESRQWVKPKKYVAEGWGRGGKEIGSGGRISKEKENSNGGREKKEGKAEERGALVTISSNIMREEPILGEKHFRETEGQDKVMDIDKKEEIKGTIGECEHKGTKGGQRETRTIKEAVTGDNKENLNPSREGTAGNNIGEGQRPEGKVADREEEERDKGMDIEDIGSEGLRWRGSQGKDNKEEPKREGKGKRGRGEAEEGEGGERQEHQCKKRKGREEGQESTNAQAKCGEETPLRLAI